MVKACFSTEAFQQITVAGGVWIIWSKCIISCYTWQERKTTFREQFCVLKKLRWQDSCFLGSFSRALKILLTWLHSWVMSQCIYLQIDLPILTLTDTFLSLYITVSFAVWQVSTEPNYRVILAVCQKMNGWRKCGTCMLWSFLQP